MIPIPFTLPDDSMGFRERRGTVTMEEGELVLRIQDQLLGVIDSDHAEVRIDPAALSDLVVKRGFLVDKLTVVPLRGESLKAVPGAKLGFLELRVWRKHREALEDLADLVWSTD